LERNTTNDTTPGHFTTVKIMSRKEYVVTMLHVFGEKIRKIPLNMKDIGNHQFRNSYLRIDSHELSAAAFFLLNFQIDVITGKLTFLHSLTQTKGAGRNRT
jgi:hypothetical protein